MSGGGDGAGAADGIRPAADRADAVADGAADGAADRADVADGRGAVLFDRDGVLNVDTAYLHRIEDWAWRPGAPEAVAAAKARGLLAIVITNQSGIGRGFYTEAEMQALHAWMNADLERRTGARIDAVYHCPYHPEASVARYRHPDHPDRKPRPGMLLRAIAEHGLDPARCLMVGDKASDMAAAEAAGVRGLLAREGDNLHDALVPALPAPPATSRGKGHGGGQGGPQAGPRPPLGMRLYPRAGSQSQFGQESFVLDIVCGGRRSGVYVDVGARCGWVHSNTALLDRLGWRGVCVEPHPGNFRALAARRPGAHCVEAAALDREGEAAFLGLRSGPIGRSGLLGTLRGEEAGRLKRHPHDLVQVRTAPLETLLQEAGAPAEIDYLDIDTEGHELQVLQGVDFARRAFRVIGIETRPGFATHGAILDLLAAQGYRPVALLGADTMFMRRPEG